MSTIATIIGSIFEIYIGNMFFSKFGDKKIQGKSYYFYLSAIGLLLIVSSLTLVKSGLIFLAFSICSFIHSSLFNLKLVKRIILTFTLIIIVSLSEMIIVLTTTLGMDTTIISLQNSNIMYTICILVAKFLAFSLLKPIKTSTFNSQNRFPLWFKIGTMILPFTSTFIITLLYRYSYLVADTIYQISTLLAAISLIIANILVLNIIEKQEVYFKTTERLLFAEAHIKNQVLHYSELYAQQEALKKFKHDSKNFYTSLISMLETLTIQDAIKYISEKMKIDTYENNTINSGHPVIDAIIHSKSLYAQKHNVLIKTIIKISTSILIDELELGVLIGNALDNAIEAAANIDTKEKKIITINIISSGDMLSIEVSNPTKNNIDVQKLNTTKTDNHLHGYGLNGIETITNKYNGNLSLSCKDNVFILSSILVNKNI